MTRYADRTTVPADSSRLEIERALTRYGASSFAYGTDSERAMMQFRLKDRLVRMVLNFPAANDKRFQLTPTGRIRRHAGKWGEEREKEIRRLWRALVLVVKAKLEACESGISTIEREFLPDIVLPDGRTVGERLTPQIAEAYATGVDAPLLLESPDARKTRKVLDA